MNSGRITSHIGVLIFGLLLAFDNYTSTVLAAEPYVALVLEVSGTMTPAVEAYDEFESGQVVNLSDNSKLQFLHYSSCTTVTVNGGKITFGGIAFEIDRGATVESEKGDCPMKISLNQDAQLGGVVFRSAKPSVPLMLSKRPDFTLVGKCRSEISLIRISQTGKTLFELEKTSLQLTLPTGAQLDSGESYVLELVSRTSTNVVAHEFMAAKESVAPKLTLIQDC